MANTSNSTASSNTSSSHTITALPVTSEYTHQLSFATKNKLGGGGGGGGMEELVKALQPENRWRFVRPDEGIVGAALGAGKGVLDGVAGRVGEEQMERLREVRRKRKRGEKKGEGEVGKVLKIRKVVTEGFEVGMVWEQARRVVDALRGEVEREVEGLVGGEEEEKNEGGLEMVRFGEDGFEVGSEDEEGEELSGGELEGGQFDEDEEEELEGEGDDLGPSADEDDEEMEDIEDDEDEDNEEEEAGVYVADPHGLNDGFFSIDDFNKQTQFLEQLDQAEDPEESDDEEIDWTADPTSFGEKPEKTSKPSRRAAAMDVDEDEDEDAEEEEDDEDGPTFGNMDLNAPDGESDEDEDDEMVDDVGDNTNEVLYKDFFAPPPRKLGKGEKQANYLERQAKKVKPVEPEPEDGVERAIKSVRFDLFNDLAGIDDDSDNPHSDHEAPTSKASKHERQRAKLLQEIRRLEAASVAKREWTLSGEARAADRPLNSLLDEDLDFERTGKPVPEITAEISESIEELIKRRILAQQFDEVIRRRPDSLSTGDVRRGQFELDDSKPQQSLAEMYEEEHIKNTNPDTYVSAADEETRKEEAEISMMWKEISGKLDALTSWHYKPKAPVPNLTIVSNVATVSMEDAQPSTAAGINGESMLAPQEIYSANKDKEDREKGEIIPKNAAPVAREEMTREEKLRRRRREKERIAKRGGVEINQRPESKKTVEKRQIQGELFKGGVKVIQRNGKIVNAKGEKVEVARAVGGGAGAFKL